MLNIIEASTYWLHIAAGFTAFLIAPVALISKKGGPTHRRWGKVYFWAMCVVVSSALVLSILRPNTFLLLVAVFSFYLAFRGFRVLRRKRPEKGDRPQLLDWLVSSATVSACGILVTLGVIRLNEGVSFGYVYIVFGAGGGLTALRDLFRYVWPATDPNAWWFVHMEGMISSYIAAMTAFSAVNFSFLPPLARWLWPTVIGGVGLAIWTRHYKRMFSKRSEGARTKSPADARMEVA